MLVEAIHVLASLPGTPPAHWRHVPAAIGLWARGRRRAEAWAPHLARTKAAILDAMPATRGRVLVLGSGPLFDVPLGALAAAFGEVVLVDLVHPRSARRNLPSNVRVLSRDLGAGLGGLPAADWMVSVNLLSQLAFGAAAGDERRAVDAHLTALAQQACPATLVTDTRYRLLDRRGEGVETFDLLYGRGLPEPAAQWQWEVAPFGEEARHTRRVHTVGAWPDWTRAATGR